MKKNTLDLAKYFQAKAEINIQKKQKDISINVDSLLIICSELIQENLEKDKLIKDFYERNTQWHQLISNNEINDSMLAALIIHLENKNKVLESEIEEIGEMVSLGYFTLYGEGAYLPISPLDNSLDDDLVELFFINK